jgi:hypothetical protein
VEVNRMIGGESCSLEFCALLHRPPLASSVKGGDLFAAERLSGFGEYSTSLHYFIPVRISIVPFLSFHFVFRTRS